MSSSSYAENIADAEKNIARFRPLVRDAKMRQRYHFMAEEGWINDPNGLIYYQGKYHFFYQYNPYDSFWGKMHWGHAVSEDLVHWEYLPLALAPSEPYDDHRFGGCFSGSAIEHDGKLCLVYTGTANHGDGFVQAQCLAISEDGVHFSKHPNNPVLSAPVGYGQSNFRDPKVWRHDGSFYMVCGAKKDSLGQALLFRSSDLVRWSFVNVLAESRGEFGCMWECPDFFPLGDRHVLLFSPMGLPGRKAMYLVGDMDYRTGKFFYSSFGEIDWGLDYYAPQSFLDSQGRRLIVGWANAWDWMPWWKDWGPTYKEYWCGSFGIPREVILTDNNTLAFIPVDELTQLRKDKFEKEDFAIAAGEGTYEIPAGDGVAFEMRMRILLSRTTGKKFSLYLRSSKEKHTAISFDLEKAEISVDRSNADGWSKGTSRSPLPLGKDELSVCIYSDQSSIELFTDDFRTVHSNNIFAGNEQNHNYIAVADGVLHIEKLETWGLATTMR